MIGMKGATVFGLCPGCDTWQVDIQGTLPAPSMEMIDAVEEAIREHATTECIPLLRLAGPQYGAAVGALA